MADSKCQTKFTKNLRIFMKYSISRLFALENPKMTLELQNLKWRTGCTKIWRIVIKHSTLRALDSENPKMTSNFKIQYSESKIRTIWGFVGNINQNSGWSLHLGTWKTRKFHEIPTNLKKSWIFSESGKNLNTINSICLSSKKN